LPPLDTKENPEFSGGRWSQFCRDIRGVSAKNRLRPAAGSRTRLQL